MELWDLYTRDRVLTGKTHVRGMPLPKDLYHLVVQVWIRNKKGEYVISQRAATRPMFPLKWECVGGSVTAGEDSYTGALREVQEEIGIDLTGCTGRVVFTEVREFIGDIPVNDIVDVWIFDYDGEITLDKATTSEVIQSKWMSVKEIEELVRQGELAATIDYFSEKVAVYE
ncbi:MAG: NUDIX domain-containing protein [Erysipelotrichaceae bacterium]|nr:NUDIX domain-containing protein [Erysipelotrichaceae bacterium]